MPTAGGGCGRGVLSVQVGICFQKVVSSVVHGNLIACYFHYAAIPTVSSHNMDSLRHT